MIQELALLAIQTPQALFLAVISLLDQPVESFPVENFGTCALRGGTLGDFGDVHPGFAALCVAFVVTSPRKQLARDKLLF